MDAKSGYLVQGLKYNWIGKIILLTVLFGVFIQIKNAARPSFLDSLRLFFLIINQNLLRKQIVYQK